MIYLRRLPQNEKDTVSDIMLAFITVINNTVGCKPTKITL